MSEKTLTIRYEEFSAPEEMPVRDRELIAKALEAQKGSYSPYSHFRVGAALRLENGVIVQGANQENAAYPSGLCAERTALFAAGSQYPGVKMESLAIVGSDNGVVCENPASPCGACRQVMAEYQGKQGSPLEIILVGSRCIRKFAQVEDVLPFIFDSLKIG